MPDAITLSINGTPITVYPGTTVAAAVAHAQLTHFRTSVTGQPRGPLCGMGVCFECRVTVDNIPHARSCTLFCREGMEVRTDA